MCAQFLQNLGTASCECLRLKLSSLRRRMKCEGSFIPVPDSISSENTKEQSSWKRVCVPMTEFWNPWAGFSLHLQGSKVTVNQARWNGKSASTQLLVFREILNVQGNQVPSQQVLRLWSFEISVYRAERSSNKESWRQLPKLWIFCQGTAEVALPVPPGLKRGTRRMCSILFQAGMWGNLLGFWGGRFSGGSIPNFSLCDCHMSIWRPSDCALNGFCARNALVLVTYCNLLCTCWKRWDKLAGPLAQKPWVNPKAWKTAGSLHCNMQWGSWKCPPCCIFIVSLRKEKLWRCSEKKLGIKQV